MTRKTKTTPPITLQMKPAPLTPTIEARRKLALQTLARIIAQAQTQPQQNQENKHDQRL